MVWNDDEPSIEVKINYERNHSTYKAIVVYGVDIFFLWYEKSKTSTSTILEADTIRLVSQEFNNIITVI